MRHTHTVLDEVSGGDEEGSFLTMPCQSTISTRTTPAASAGSAPIPGEAAPTPAAAPAGAPAPPSTTPTTATGTATTPPPYARSGGPGDERRK